MVKVDQTGKVTAISKGKATVTVTSSDGQSSDECEIEVYIPISSLAMTKDEYILFPNNELQLNVQIQPSDATNKKLKYSNSDSNVVQVDTDGKVTAISSGRAELTIEPEEGVGTAKCTIFVVSMSLDKEEFVYDGTSKRPKVTVTASEYTLKEGEDYTVDYVDNVSEGEATVTVTGINSYKGSLQKTFYIKLDKPQIVRNGEKVELTALAQGNASIIYTKDGSDPTLDNGIKYNGKNLALDVYPGYIKAIAVDRFGHAGDINTLTLYDVSLNKTSLRLEKGAEDKLQAKVLPEDAPDKNVVWRSSDESIVKVDQNGKVSAVSKGKATVTATSSDGASCATCEVEVIIPVTSLSMKETEYILYTEDELQLDVQVQPDNANNKGVTWTSSNTAVATVDANGNVTAVAKGTTTITATAKDGSGKSASCEVTVIQPVTKITLSNTSIDLKVSDTATITATATR